MERNNNALIEENMNLAARIVKLYFNAFENRVGFEKDDLTQESYLALIKAAKRFDSSKGVKFETFATTVIKHELTEYCSRIYDRTERIMIDDIAVETGRISNLTAFGNLRQDIKLNQAILLTADSSSFGNIELTEDTKLLFEKLKEMLHGKKSCALGALALLNNLRGISQVDTARILGVTPAFLRACVKRARNRLLENKDIAHIKDELLGLAG